MGYYMLAAVRKDRIQKYMLEKKEASVTELAEHFSVSEETIRRDLRALEEEGFVILSHGGAMLAHRMKATADNKTLAGIFVESKQIIAKQCSGFIRDGDCIYLDGSTTASAICEEIEGRNVTILTNSLRVINRLSESKTVNIICVGGNFKSARQSFGGLAANDILSRYYVDTAFISCRSLSMANGITDSDEDSASAKAIISTHANRVCLIADHSKFDKTSFVQVCDYQSITDIVTDKPLSDTWRAFCEKNSIQVWDTTQAEEAEEL